MVNKAGLRELDWDDRIKLIAAITGLVAVVVGMGAMVGFVIYKSIKEARTVNPREYAEQYIESNPNLLVPLLANEVLESGKLPDGLDKDLLEDIIQYRVDWKFGRSIYLRSDPPAIRAIPIYARVHAPLNDNATQTLTAKIKFRMLVLEKEVYPRLLAIEPVEDPFVYVGSIPSEGN